ncbi:ABC transporter permease [Epilithonimonas arachidiradicis]|uniref:Lipoprotein-releasing system permease protein n=1 Tax=Epilithonimonas arachidiradicis TaxID=1617282 RepID=A0A420CL13_9FLAO|nr:ABC transporter permease [Epilithonimonas arachidiradicis]RKE79074.1 lipoprotein-releasing system permease protein [Epilithonimonas arachidiradicis]GGG60029.1 membrane protein [Epilithonimonas arachidiradicis]
MKNAFYIASRYLIARKGSTAVTFITWLAAFAMVAAVAAMFIIISVFSGLEEMNKQMIANLHADLTVKSKVGKVLPEIDKIQNTLRNNQDISSFSKVIEEKVYLGYKDNGEIAYLRGVDSAYTSVNPINDNIFYGKYPDFKYSNEVIMENGLDNRLSLPVNSSEDFATILMPKPGKGIIQQENDIFNKKDIYVTGVFPGNDQLDNYIISPIELAQELLGLPKTACYQIVIKLKNPAKADLVKSNLSKIFGNQITINTKSEENAAFWKMINTEKLMIYLIFGLVIFITTFNLAGAITILQLDKKDQAKSLIALGFNMKNLRLIYFFTGLLIVMLGILCGLIIGSAICFLQINTGFFKASETLAFPVKIELINYFIVSGIALFFGLSISWLFSKINKKHIFEN